MLDDLEGIRGENTTETESSKPGCEHFHHIACVHDTHASPQASRIKKKEEERFKVHLFSVLYGDPIYKFYSASHSPSTFSAPTPANPSK